jgi:regulator of protease activity HflC (stomatin/prohibitin superfamily)
VSATQYFLSEGSHATREKGMCAMEWVAYIAGEEHSDAPVCVDPALRRFGIALNDNLPDDLRQRLRPYLARMIGTAGDGLTQGRLWMLADWAVRVAAAEAQDVSGRRDLGDKLRAVEPIVDKQTAKAAERVAREVRAYASAAAYAAAADDAAAYAAAAAASADAAAYAAAYAAYAAAASASAASASTASAASVADARRAMWEKLLPSALDLLDRMLPTEQLVVPALPDVAEELVRA